MQVELTLQRVPAEWDEAGTWHGRNATSLRWCGLVWRHQLPPPTPPTTNESEFGFFGLLSDADSEDGLIFGWRPTSTAPLQVARLPRPTMAAFVISVQRHCRCDRPFPNIPIILTVLIGFNYASN